MTVLKNSKADLLSKDYQGGTDSDKGFVNAVLVPYGYTTAERDALVNVQEGTIILNTTTSKLDVYIGTTWQQITSA